MCICALSGSAPDRVSNPGSAKVSDTCTGRSGAGLELGGAWIRMGVGNAVVDEGV